MYIHGNYHGTPLHIAEIRKGEKVYLTYAEGSNNLIIEAKTSRDNILPWVFLALTTVVVSFAAFLILDKKRKKYLVIHMINIINSD